MRLAHPMRAMAARRIVLTEDPLGDLGADAPMIRARAAGGPIDLATYSCGCGLIFSASVSTTVTCPHCGCEQAW